MIGDEILVVGTSKSAPVNLPQLYVPYVVTAIEYPNVPGSRTTSLYPTYRLDLLERTDNEYSFSTLAGGIRVKDLYLNSTDDNWILSPGFRRGELNEGENPSAPPPIDEIQYGETINVKPNVGDKIILIDKEEALQAYQTNQPELFTPYVVISKHDYNFQLVKVDEYDYWKEWLERGSDEVPSPQKIFYPLDYKWIDANTPRATKVDRKTISEHKETGLSPELEIGDTILIIDINKGRFQGQYTIPPEGYRPEMWTPYEVVEKKTSGGKSKWPFNYILVPEGEIWTTGRNPQGEETSNEKLLYPWIYQWIPADTPTATNVDRLTITEHDQPELSPDLDSR